MSFASVIVMTFVLAACSGDDPAVIRVAGAERGTVAEVVEAPATVTARATATVTAAADGMVALLRVREGQRVRQGQVLLRIESPSARRQLRQAQSADRRAASAGTGGGVPTLSGAGQADATARRAFERARRTATRIADPTARRQALSALRVTQSQYSAARASADQAAAQLAAGLGSLSAAVAALSSAQRVQTRAAVDIARRTIRDLTVRAPIAGTVSLTPVQSAAGTSAADDLLAQLPQSLQSQAGQALGGSGTSSVSGALSAGAPVSNGQALVSVTDTSTLSLTAQVDETDVLLVNAGIEASAELDAVPDATYAATVTTIDPTPTTSTRGGVSYVVRLTLGRGTDAAGSTAPTPRPGMSAVVDLRVRTSRGVLAVPAPAVFRDGRSDAVYVVINGVARRRVVRLGAQGASRVEVVEGLKEGEQIVVRGVDRVSDGQEVP